MKGDWIDISKHVVPRELLKVSEYKKRLNLVEYLESLHPEVSRATETVLNGDYESALRSIYASLDTSVRSFIKIKHNGSTVPAIGKAFKDGVLTAPYIEDNDHARSFLQGVLGYYRNNILHNPLPNNRNSIEASLSLFVLAHEGFILFNLCSKIRV